MEFPRVLSIQSHVVYGYVGNKSATFPLQLLGFEVDAINSVQFCNHTGYKKVAGQILTEKDLGDLVDGLAANGLDHYSHLLTGYIGSESFLKRISSLLTHLKAVNPDLLYVCDPVMGDNGKMYVPEGLLPIYKDLITPLADIITPNQFELELLTDNKINNINDAWHAIEKLHKKGCKTVVVSSSDLGKDGYLLALASTTMLESSQRKRVTIEMPRFQKSFTGTGDLFAALLLAWLNKTNNNIKESLEKTIASLQAVLKRTVQADTGTKQNLELKIIQSKHEIEEPNVEIGAKYL